MSADMLTAEETAWLEGGETLHLNPIVKAFGEHLTAVLDGTTDSDDGLVTEKQVMERWIWYLAEGEQEISWHPPILVQANRYFADLAKMHGLEYRPGMTAAA